MGKRGSRRGAAWNLQPGGLGVGWGEGQGFRHGRDKVGFPGIGFPRESTSSAPSDKVSSGVWGPGELRLGAVFSG